jgi:16S rRNA (cytidine1402-2'-O)-methyltransferase
MMAELDRGDVALVSDAGTPAIADPGHELVQLAAAAGHRIVPVPGASSMAAAVSASGLVPGPFLFVGFLPRSGEERRVGLGKAVSTGYPFVLFESPIRTAATLAEVEQAAPGRRAAVARELTKLHEEILRGSVDELARGFADQAPRGEVVIVVGEQVESAGNGQPDANDEIARSLLGQGVKPSRAARELSTITGLPAADAYALVQRIAKEGRGS